MRYIVRGTSGFGGVRVIAADAAEALLSARLMSDRGVKRVEVIDEGGAHLTFSDFCRSTRGHSLSPDQIELIAATADVATSGAARLGEVFYARLFALAPAVRAMFSDDLAGQQQKLVATVVSMVEQIEKPELFVRLVTGLAGRHVGYGAAPDHYPVVGQALLDSLEALLGPRFTPEVREAWATLYDDLSAAMLAAYQAEDGAQAEPAGSQEGSMRASRRVPSGRSSA